MAPFLHAAARAVGACRRTRAALCAAVLRWSREHAKCARIPEALERTQLKTMTSFSRPCSRRVAERACRGMGSEGKRREAKGGEGTSSEGKRRDAKGGAAKGGHGKGCAGKDAERCRLLEAVHGPCRM